MLSRADGSTASVLQATRTEPFDFIFIDANKPDYKAYVNTIFDLGLLAPEGVIYAGQSSSLFLASYLTLLVD
jgi:predicted O-methyltransferase YrrM